MGPVTTASGDERSLIEWASAGVALDRHTGASGDLSLIARVPSGVLVAVIDGLGHGPEAASAAKQAARILDACAGDSVTELVHRCHEGLRKTRGVVMSLAWFNGLNSSMTWIGVGNVDALLLRADPFASRPRESINARGGVVGYQLPPLRAAAVSVSPGDTLIMATDGIRSGFTSGLSGETAPREMADSIMRQYCKGSDDALVLVVRYTGATA
jgi:negative regulator of sigma-B (phosphoserine phosphatase)